ncbi:MAG: sugar ABC transporter substrate-binding protein [Caldilineaceae bacterium]
MLFTKNLSRRGFLQVASLALAEASLSACVAIRPSAVPVAAAQATATAAPIPSAEINITLSSWYITPSFRDLVSQFTDNHPNIKIQLIEGQYLDLHPYHDKLRLSLAAGTVDDIVAIEDPYLAQFADSGGLADITEAMVPYKDKVVPYKWRLGVYKGKNYALPGDCSPCMLYYRSDIFEQYGVDPTAIETYDDWLTAGLKLKEATDGKVKLWGLFKDQSYPPFINWLWQQGGGLYDLDETKVTIDQPVAINTLEFMKKLWDSGTVYQNPSWDDIFSDWGNGTIVCFPDAVWIAGMIKFAAIGTSGKWKVTRVPAWTKGGARAFTNGGSQFAIPAQSKHIAESFGFLEFAQLTQAGQETVSVMSDTAPGLINAENWPLLSEPVDFYGGQTAFKLYAEVNAEVQPYVFGKGWQEATEIIGRQMKDMYDGKIAPKEALQAAANEIREKQKLD